MLGERNPQETFVYTAKKNKYSYKFLYFQPMNEYNFHIIDCTQMNNKYAYKTVKNEFNRNKSH